MDNERENKPDLIRDTTLDTL